MKLAQRFLPAPVVNQIIPVGDEIVDRTPGVAEGHAAIHATRALIAQLLFRKVLVNLEPVVHALGDGTANGALAAVLHEPRRFTHATPPPVQVQERAGQEYIAGECG